MNTPRVVASTLLALQLHISAGEIVLALAFIPVESPVDDPVQVVSVPYYTGEAQPEASIAAITQPYFIRQGNDKKTYDINLASVAKLSVYPTIVKSEPRDLYAIVWDFSNADPKRVNADLIKAVVTCLERTIGKKKGIHSKLIGIEKFPAHKKRITAAFPLVLEKRKANKSR